MNSLIEDEDYSPDIGYDIKYNKTPEEIRKIQEMTMSSFADKWGKLTVEQVKELNKAAEELCAMELTSE